MLRLDYRNPTQRVWKAPRRRRPVKWSFLVKLLVISVLLVLLIFSLLIPLQEHSAFPERWGGERNGSVPGKGL